MTRGTAATIRVCRIAQKNGGNMSAAIKQHAKEANVRVQDVRRIVNKTLKTSYK